MRESSTGVSTIAIAAAATSAYETEDARRTMSMTPSAKQTTRNVPLPQSVLRVSTSGNDSPPVPPADERREAVADPSTRTP